MKLRSSRGQPQGRQTSLQRNIQQRAYDLYMKRGQEPGHEMEDWLRAEQQIREEQERDVSATVSR